MENSISHFLADDPSPPRMVSHDLFLCSYVTSEANLGSTGSTTIQTVFPHVQPGHDSHLAICTTRQATQANAYPIMVKSKDSGVRDREGSRQRHLLGQGVGCFPMLHAGICKMAGEHLPPRAARPGRMPAEELGAGPRKSSGGASQGYY